MRLAFSSPTVRSRILLYYYYSAAVFSENRLAYPFAQSTSQSCLYHAAVLDNFKVHSEPTILQSQGMWRVLYSTHSWLGRKWIWVKRRSGKRKSSCRKCWTPYDTATSAPICRQQHAHPSGLENHGLYRKIWISFPEAKRGNMMLSESPASPLSLWCSAW